MIVARRTHAKHVSVTYSCPTHPTSTVSCTSHTKHSAWGSETSRAVGPRVPRSWFVDAYNTQLDKLPDGREPEWTKDDLRTPGQAPAPADPWFLPTRCSLGDYGRHQRGVRVDAAHGRQLFSVDALDAKSLLTLRGHLSHGPVVSDMSRSMRSTAPQARAADDLKRKSARACVASQASMRTHRGGVGWLRGRRPRNSWVPTVSSRVAHGCHTCGSHVRVLWVPFASSRRQT